MVSQELRKTNWRMIILEHSVNFVSVKTEKEPNRTKDIRFCLMYIFCLIVRYQLRVLCVYSALFL